MKMFLNTTSMKLVMGVGLLGWIGMGGHVQVSAQSASLNEVVIQGELPGSGGNSGRGSDNSGRGSDSKGSRGDLRQDDRRGDRREDRQIDRQADRREDRRADRMMEVSQRPDRPERPQRPEHPERPERQGR